ncbi:MAG: HEAT repeat domain-containing protein [Acidobacteriales bacterium]|nr:HEAT repeat domain-containing protein [Terriglobales bacterium]
MGTKSSLLGVLLVGLSAIGWAQEPQLKNAKLVPRSAASGLQQELNAIARAEPGPAWIGYAVPVVPGERTMCCLNFTKFKSNPRCCAGCNLEGGNDGGFFNGTSQDCKQLEPAKNFFVLLRLSNHQIAKAKAFSVDCGLDAGGLSLYWLGEVQAPESIAVLEKLAADFGRDADHKLAQQAISAIALHGDASADAALDRLVAKGKPAEVRQQAAFWLGNTRGRHGLDTLRQMVQGDESEDLLEQVVFAISQNTDPEAQPELIRLARSHDRAEVRAKALFWLAQQAGKKVGSVITDAVERDPDTDVKKKAVFALTQMPQDEGVPLLIQVAKTNRNPVVRKEAIFWLGQSGDSRALDYIESILVK